MKKLLVLALPCLLSCSGMEGELSARYLNELQAYREGITADKRETYLALVGRYRLNEGDTMDFGRGAGMDIRVQVDDFPDAAGQILLRNDSVFFIPSKDINVRMDSVEIIGPTFVPENGDPQTPTFTHDRFSWHFMNREGNHFIRVRDPEAPAIAAFTGYEWYEPAADFVLKGNVTYYDPPKVTEVPSVFEFTERSEFIAQLSFDYMGERHTLDVQQDGFVTFSDATTGDTTYGSGRYLWVTMPASDGPVTIDFNYAYNPPCIFSRYTTCQFAPRQNRLPFPVQAGEKKFARK